MVKRTVEISRDPCHLAVRDGQMLVLRRGEPPTRLPAHPHNLVGSVPVEDLGVLMVDERETTYSHALLAEIAEHGGALVICGRDHHPAGMYLPLSTNTQLLSRLESQLAVSKPTLKRLWQVVVQAKIRAQAANLSRIEDQDRLLAIADRVRSGDTGNAEAVAAAMYWPAFFRDVAGITQPFRRVAGDRSSPPPNNLLDYGYAALRATVARAIVSAGLLPALGIKHRGRGNPFCLADDLMEPLRPLMDARVRYLALRGDFQLDQPTKAELLRVLAEPVYRAGQRSPLLVAVSTVIADVVGVLRGDAVPEDVSFPGLTRDPQGRRRSAKTEPAPPPPITDSVSTDSEPRQALERQEKGAAPRSPSAS